MNLGTGIDHVIGYCWKGFEGHRSKVKVIERPCVLLLQSGGIRSEPAQTTPKLPDRGGGVHREKGLYHVVKGALKGPYW